MIAAGIGSSMNMLCIILIVSGILLLLLLLFYYISIAVDSWDVKNNDMEEKDADFLKLLNNEAIVKVNNENNNTIESNKEDKE